MRFTGLLWEEYTNYLRATCSGQPYPVGMAAVLPCFWIYREVGNYIYRHHKPNNPNQAWIDTYAGEAFATVVEDAIRITEAVAVQSVTGRAKADAASFCVFFPLGMALLGQCLPTGKLFDDAARHGLATSCCLKHTSCCHNGKGRYPKGITGGNDSLKKSVIASHPATNPKTS